MSSLRPQPINRIIRRMRGIVERSGLYIELFNEPDQSSYPIFKGEEGSNSNQE